METEYHLKWTPDDLTEAPPNDVLEEQLGLRLRPEKRPVEYLVIDRVERPGEN